MIKLLLSRLRLVGPFRSLFLAVLLFSGGTAFAQPVWAPGFPQLRAESRSFGMGVRFTAPDVRVYYVVYTEAGNPGALTALQIRNNTGGAANRITNGSFTWEDAISNGGTQSYCDGPPPGCSNLPMTARVYGIYSTTPLYDPAGPLGAYSTATNFRVYFTAEFIATPGVLTAPVFSNVTPPTAARCFKVGSAVSPPDAGKNKAVLSVCAPSQIQMTVSYTGVDAYATNRAQINWGDATALTPHTDLLLLNPAERNKEFRRYEATLTHTYLSGGVTTSNPPGGECTYHIDMDLVVLTPAASVCATGTNQDEEHTVYDDPGIKGTLDVNPNGPDAADEEFEVCEGDRTAVPLVDASDFNCTDAAGGNELGRTPSNPNNGARWVQFVYGVTGTNVTNGAPAAPNTSKVAINGVPFDNTTTWPIYGPVVYVATTTQPFATALPIQMPDIATTGQIFRVEMRSWNICRAYDFNTGDGDGLNPIGGVFDVGTNTNNRWFGPGPGFAFPGNGTLFPDAAEAPVVTTKNIIMIGKPVLPVAQDKEFCAGTVLNPPNVGCGAISAANQALSFSIAAPTSPSSITWYFGNPLSGGVALTNQYGTNCRFFRPGSLGGGGAQGTMRTALTTGASGIYTLYVRYTVGNGCVSDPVPVTMTIRPALSVPGAPTAPLGSSPVCNGTTNVTYQMGAGSADVTINANNISNTGAVNFATRYLWSTGTTGVTLDATTGTAITADFAIAPQPNPQTNATFAVAREFVNPITGSTTNRCVTLNSTNLTVPVDGTTSPGTIAGTQTICSGDPVTAITIGNAPTPLRGAIQGWEVSVNGSLFALDGTLGTANPLTPPVPIIGGVQTVYRYQAVVDNGACNTVRSAIATITVNPRAATAVLAGTATICQGVSTNLTVTITGGTGPFSVVYNDGSGNTTVNAYASGANIAVSPATTRTYTLVSVTDAVNCTPVTLSGTATVTVSNPTSAVIDGDFDICPTTTADINVVITGGVSPYALRYTDGINPTVTLNGYISGDPITVGPLIASRTYTIVDVRDANTCLSLSNSGSAEITVGSLPTTAAFSGGGSVCQNATRNLVLNITGGVNPYHVIVTPTSGPVINLPSYTNGANIPIPTAAAGSIDYSVTLIEDNCGASLPVASITGNIQTVVVNPLPVGGASTVGPVCSGTAFSFDPQVNITNAVASNFAWTASYPAGLTGGPANGVGNVAATLTNVSGGQLSASFTVTPTSQTGTCGGTAFVMTVQINPAPNITAGQVKTICSGDAVGKEIFLTPANLPAGTVFNWSAPTMSNAVPQGTAGTNVAMGAAGAIHINDVLTNTTGAPITATYSVTPSHPGTTCVGTQRDIVITINPEPVIAPAQVKTICSGAAVAYSILLAPLNAPAGTRFTWAAPTMSNGVPQGTAQTNVAMGTPGTIHINDVLTNTTGSPITATYTITPNTAAPANCIGDPVDVVITVNPAPVVTPLQAKTICSGDAVDYEILLTPANMPAGTRFSWVAPTMSAGGAQGTAQTNVAMGAAGTFHITDVLTNTSGSPITATYNVTTNTTPAGCTNTSVPIVITVNPAPNLATGQVKTICSGEQVDYRVLLTPNNMPAGTTFTWSAPTMSAGGAQGSGGTAVPATDALHITDVLVNTTAAPITATYTITPSNGTCDGTDRTVVVTINPLPAPNPIVGQGTVCAGPAIILYQVAPHAGSTYTWTIDPQFTVFGGGGPNNFFVLLQFPAVGSGNISVVETNSFAGKNCDGIANVLPIIAAPAPGALTINGPDPVCKNQTGVVYEVPVGIFNPTSTYTWTASGANIVSATSGVGLRQITVDFGLLSAASITVNETSSSGCAGTPTTLNISVSDRPSMLSSATTSVCSGNAPTLVFSSTLPSIYNWEVISVAGSITGATIGNTGSGNLNQVLTNVAGFAGSVTYRITPVGTAAPNCAGPTQDVVVTVNPEPVLNLTNKSLCSDQLAAYEIKLTPLNLPAGTTFTWGVPVMSSGGAQGTSGTMIPMGAAGTIHINDSFVNATSAPITATYTIQATSGLGCNSNQPAASRIVVFTINPEPAGANDNTPVVCSNLPIGYDLQNNVATLGNNLITGTTYSWVAASNGNVVGESITPQSGAIITDVVRNVTTSDQPVVYTVTPTSSGACAGNTFIVTVLVRPEPRGYNDATTITCSDVPLAYDLAGNVANTVNGGNNLTAGTTFSWLAVANPNVIGESTSAQPDPTIDDVLNNVTTLDQSVVYTVTPTSANGCVGDPFTVTVTVRPEPRGYNDPLPQVCSGVASNYNLEANILNTVQGGNGLITGTTYSWVATTHASVSGESTSAQSGKFITDVLINQTAIDQAVVYTITPTSSVACAGNPFTVTINVHPEPVGFDDNSPSICSDAAVAYNLTANVANTGAGGNGLSAGTVFSWVAANNTSVSGESTTPQSGNIITDILNNVTNSNQVVIYTVTPTSGLLCAGDPFDVSVTVRPEPRGHDDNTPFVCSDVIVNYDLSANVADTGLGGNNLITGTTYSWVAASNVNVGGESTAPQTGSLITDILNNVTNSNQTVIYTVTPTSASACVGNSFVVTITVRPEPRGFNDTPAAVCSNLPMSYNLAANIANTGAGGNNVVVGTTFSWSAADNPNTTGESTALQTGSVINNTIRNLTNTNQTIVYTVVPTSADLCVGNAFTVTVVVQPEPKGFDDVSPNICSDAPLLYNLSLNIANTGMGGNNLTTGTTYSWVAASNGNVSGESIAPQAGSVINDALNNVTTSNQVVIYTVTPTSDLGCVGGTFQISVTVRPEPRGFNDATPVTCSDVALSYDLAANIANTGAGGNNLTTGTTYSWVAASNASVTGESTLPQAGAFINDVINNVTNANQTVVYTVTPTNGTCAGNSFTVTVTVRPEPRGFDDATPNICSDAAVNYNLATNISNIGSGGNNLVTGTTYSWQAASNLNVTGESTSAVASAMITDVLNNVTTNPEVVVYTVTPTSSDFCVGSSFLVSVTVRPEPRGHNDATPVTCSDVALNIDLAANIANTGNGGNNFTAGTTYSWVAANNASVGGESTAPQAGAFITDVLNNVTTSNQLVVYSVTPSNGGCAGNVFQISVTVRPEPRGYNDATYSVCSDVAAAYPLATNISNVGLGGNNLVAGTIYSWLAATNPNVTGESDVTPGTAATINDVLTNITGSNQTVNYTVTPTSALGCAGNTFVVSITVRPEPRGFDDASTIICSDAASVNYDLAANIANIGAGGNGVAAGTTYSWIAATQANVTGESDVTPGTTQIINDVLNNVTNVNQVVTYTVTPTSSGGCVGDPFTVSVTVRPEPRGFNEAVAICSDIALAYDLALNVTNVGLGGNNLVTGTTFSWLAASNVNVTGESTSAQTTLFITDVLNNVTTSNQVVIYTVTPTSAQGCVGNSFTVTVTVRPEPRGFNEIPAQVCSGTTLNHDLAANIANTGSGGNNLTTGTTYSWQAANNGNVTGESTTLQAGAFITDVLTNVTNANHTVVYTVTPTSTLGCAGNPFTVSITVQPEPKGFDDTAITCSDVPSNYSLVTNISNTGSGGNNLVIGTTYSWIAADNANVTGESIGVPGTTPTITDDLVNITNGNELVVYTVTPTSANGCVGDPFTVSITVRPEPKGFNDNTPLACSDVAFNYDLALNIANTVSGGNNLVAGTTYSWVAASNANVTGEGSGTTATITDVINNVTNANQVVVYTVTPTSASGCIGDPFTVSVTVRPEPRGFNDNSPVVCSDVAVAYVLSTNIANTVSGGNNLIAGTTYSWVAANNPNVTGESTAPVVAASITDMLTNITNANQSVVYTVTPTSASTCVGNDFIVTVTVRPEPRGFNDSSPLICSDANVNYTLASNISNLGSGGNNLVLGTTFEWVTTDNPNVSGETLSPVTSGTINDVLNNITNGNELVVYTVTPTSTNGCDGDPFTVTVTVMPEPKGFNDPTPIICSDAAVAYDLTANIANTVSGGNNLVTGTTFSWIATTNAAIGGESTSAQTGAIITDVLNNVTAADQVVVYTVTPTTNGCVGNTFQVSVTVRPEPRGFNDPSRVICSDANVNYDLVANINNTGSGGNGLTTGTTYSWVAVDNPSVTGETTGAPGTTSTINDVLTNVSGSNQIVVYTVTPTSANSCVGNTFQVSVTVRSEPVGAIDASEAVCSDEPISYNIQSQNINILGNGVASLFTYTVVSSDPANVSAAGKNRGVASAAAITDSYTNLTSVDVLITYTVTPFSNPGSCAGTPFDVIVTIHPEPKAPATTPLARCSDVPVNFDLQTVVDTPVTGNSVLSFFKYTVASSNGAIVPAGPSRNSPTAAQITDVYTNLSNVDVDITYTVTPVSQADDCEGTPFTVVVTIHPEPVGISIVDPVCSSLLAHNIQTAHITNGVPSLFTYTVSSSDPTNVPPGADRIVASGANITDSYTNSTGVDVTITYTITPQSQANGCLGTPFTYTVTISSKPVGAAVTKASVCSDVLFNFDPQNDITNGVISTFTWSRPVPPGLTVRTAKVPQTGVISEAWTNTGNVVIDVLYTVTPTAGSCAGDAFVITVPIQPEPVLLSTLDVTRCSDVDYGIILDTQATSIGASTYDISAIVQAGLTGVASSGTASADNLIFGDSFTNQTSNQLSVTYSVTPNGTNGCIGDPLDVVFTINPEPVLAPQAIDPICSNNADNPSVTNIVLGTNGSSVGAGSYRLTALEFRYVGDPTFTGVSPVGFTPNPANAALASSGSQNILRNDRFLNTSDRAVEVKYTIVPRSSPQACDGDALDFIIVVHPQPKLDPDLSPTPVCSEVASGITLAVDPGPPASVPAASYIIRSINFTGLTPGPVNEGTGTGKPASAIFDDVYINTTSSMLQVVYEVAPVSGNVVPAGGCIGPDEDVILEINPAPNLEVANAFACTDDLFGSGITLATTFPGDPDGIPAANYDLLSVTFPAALTPDPGNQPVANGIGAAALLNDTYVNSTLTTQTVLYTLSPVSAAGCNGPTEVVQLTVEPIIEVIPNPAAVTLCGDGLAASNIQLTSGSAPSAGSISFNYSSVSTSLLVSGYSPTVNNLPNPSVIDDFFVNNSNNHQTVTFTVTPRAPGAKNGAGCTGTAETVVLTLEPKPKVTLPTTKTICEETAVNLTLTSLTVPSPAAGGTAALSFDAAIPTATGTITGFSAVPVTYNLSDVINDVLVNDNFVSGQLENGTVEYVITPRFGACTGDPTRTTVVVAPRPDITPIADFDICHGEAFAAVPIQVNTNPAATFITWTVTANTNVNGESNGAGSAFSQVLFNTHNGNGSTTPQDPQFVTYTIKARNVANIPACDGPDETLVVGVFPTPRIINLASSINVCNGETRTVNLSGSATGSAFTWGVPDNGGNPDLPGLPAGGGTSIVQTFVNNGESLGNYTYQITPTVTIPSSGATCIGNDAVMIVNVSPPVFGLASSNDGDNDSYICLGSKDFVNLSFGGMPLFEYTYTDGTTSKTVVNRGFQDPITVQPTATTTYTLTQVKDAFGCIANPVGQFVTVNVGVTDATFSVVGPTIACSPFQAQFQHNQVAGVQYSWRWLDGNADSVYVASTSQSPQVIPHTFFNPSPGGQATFSVFLDARLDDNYPGNCFKSTKQTVKVYPTITTAVFPDKDVICSDETITFVNSSQGVIGAGHRWFYRVQGSSGELEVKSTQNVNFKLTNTTASNPIIYEVVYESTNGNCPAAPVVTPITVYRGVDANFSYTPPTLFIGGHSTTTFTNTSVPVNTAEFRYEWEFGLDAAPATGLGAGPFVMDYTTPGPKEIILVATNMIAEAAGLFCMDEYREIMNITVPPLEVDFTAVPLQACFPTDITITENMATGDTFAWRVLDNGGTAASSNADLPVFKIPSPGRYTIELTTANSFTGDQKTLTKDVIIYDLPMASFDIRPAVVFVPDGIVETYNFSDGATEYEWDFGDGTIELTKEPTHNYRVEGVYDIMLIAKNNHGPDANGDDVVCVDTLVRKLTAKQGGVTRVPNAFTPNPNGPGDGIPGDNTFNDVFLPQVRGAEEFNMQVFDRWGNLIFESNSAKVGWNGYDKNGRILPAGVYVFKLTLRLSDGQRTTQIGDITMIR
jgi:gliding motility-associated-like protein